LCSFERRSERVAAVAPVGRPRDRRSPDGGPSAGRLTRVCSGFISDWSDDTSVDRHWTHELVALSGVLAGAVIFAAGDATPLAAGVAALGAVALLLPELAADRRTSPR
jgi:hypothetical protein